MYIDTHAHLYLEEFDEDLEAMEERLHSSKVERVYLPNIDVSSIAQVKQLSERNPELFKPMMGLHPCYVKEDYKEQLKHIEQTLKDGSFDGVGEIGVDLYWDLTFQEEQIEVFKTQLLWARDLKLPVTIHSRKCLEMTIEIVSELQDGNLSGVFHCFNGTKEQAEKISSQGFYMGIGGVVTYKNAGVDQVVKEIPLNHIVLETDAPYLSPVPFRGKRNESSYINFIAEKIAVDKGTSVDEVARITTKNAKKVFG